MKIKLTDFTLRHFDSKFGGTKILDYTPEEFEKRIAESTSNITIEDFDVSGGERIIGLGNIIITDGYAPFCKYLAIRNFTKARVGSLPITLENYQYIRSGYSARREGELPVFSRWLELPIKPPTAEWLVLVLYSHEQLVHEAALNISATGIQEEVPDCDYGIVAILGQSHPNGADPMKPETMIRNAGYNTEDFQEKALEKFRKMWKNAAMVGNKTQDDKLSDLPEALYDNDIKSILSLQGMLTGGSGAPFSTEEYLRSVEFWEKNVTIK